MIPVIRQSKKDNYFFWDVTKQSYFLRQRPKSGFGFGQIESKVVSVKKRHIHYKLG